MQNITVIGQNSFLAKALARNPKTQNWVFLDYKAALSDPQWASQSDIVINCAYHPDLRTEDYSPVKDIDFLLAGYCANYNPYYIMLSSRLVYGSAPKNLILTEDMQANPKTVYAKNKHTTEQFVSGLIPPEKLIILRNGNIFGQEYGRKTFFGQMLTSLKDDGVLRFDISPDSKRDFLYVDEWAEYMCSICANPTGGVYNIGSGFGIEVDDLGKILISAHGSGHIEYSRQFDDGQFILNVQKSRQTFGLSPYTKNHLIRDILSIFDA